MKLQGLKKRILKAYDSNFYCKWKIGKINKYTNSFEKMDMI